MYRLASINVGTYMLGDMESTMDRKSICTKILNTLQTQDISIICTQEDVLVGTPSNIRPEFESLYTDHGYTWVTYDIYDESHSNTLKQAHPTKQVYFGNIIYVQKHIVPQTRSLVYKPHPSPACLAQIQLDELLIANVHLCGGRFDDIKVFEDPEFYRTKLDSVQALNHSIVCGDFNATRRLGEPGGLKNYRYPIDLSKQYSKRHDTSILFLWNTWQCSPIDFFYDQHYKSCFNDSQLQVIEETTNRGHYVVDWVFYDPTQVKKYDSQCESMYDDISILSDHHMIMFVFSTSVDIEPCGKSYFV